MAANNSEARLYAKNALAALCERFMAFLEKDKAAAVGFAIEKGVLCDLIAERLGDSFELSGFLRIGGARHNEKDYIHGVFAHNTFLSAVENALLYGEAKSKEYMAQFDPRALWRAQKYLRNAARQFAAQNFV